MGSAAPRFPPRPGAAAAERPEGDSNAAEARRRQNGPGAATVRSGVNNAPRAAAASQRGLRGRPAASPGPAAAARPPPAGPRGARSDSPKLCGTYRTRRHYRIPLGFPLLLVPPLGSAPHRRGSIAEWPRTTPLKRAPLPIGLPGCPSGRRPEGGRVLTLPRSGLHRAARQSHADGATIGQHLPLRAARHPGSCSLRGRRLLPTRPR